MAELVAVESLWDEPVESLFKAPFDVLVAGVCERLRRTWHGQRNKVSAINMAVVACPRGCGARIQLGDEKFVMHGKGTWTVMDWHLLQEHRICRYDMKAEVRRTMKSVDTELYSRNISALTVERFYPLKKAHSRPCADGDEEVTIEAMKKEHPLPPGLRYQTSRHRNRTYVEVGLGGGVRDALGTSNGLGWEIVAYGGLTVFMSSGTTVEYYVEARAIGMSSGSLPRPWLKAEFPRGSCKWWIEGSALARAL